MDLLWVSRLNLAIGVPDEAMLLTEEVLGPIFDRMLSMPMYIIVASLLPPGTEATMFALTMGLINFGTILASYLGVGLLWLLGGVEAPTELDPLDAGFENLQLLVLIRSLCKLLPLLFTVCLIPEGSPRTLAFATANRQRGKDERGLPARRSGGGRDDDDDSAGQPHAWP